MQNSSLHHEELKPMIYASNLDLGDSNIMMNQGGIGDGTAAGLHCKRTSEEAGFMGPDGRNLEPPPKKVPPPNGKKTKGRVKIKMEFIDNKLRRYTTFSKRKTGIMKKAYELSTLTGTQVMLLVASETGHVYTFATRKLQPMITSEAGKALIQTCLNSPDPPMTPGGSAPDQRMSATGFEETDLTYSVGEDLENKDSKALFNSIMGSGNQNSLSDSDGSSNQGMMSPSPGPVLSASSSVLQDEDNPGAYMSAAKITSEESLLSVQLPTTASFATVLSSGNSLQQAGNVQFGTVAASQVTQSVTSQQSTSQAQPQTVYRINTQTPIVSIPGTVMYQTPQGVVYATPASGGLQEALVLNLGQHPTSALSLKSETGGAQQYITIPVPVPLSASQQQIVSSQISATSVSQGDASNKKEKGKK